MLIPSPRAKRKARIEIIPLIDIVFFLLATFVMVSLSMVKNKGVPVNLPKAETSTAIASGGEDYTSITVTRDGRIFFNKESVSIDQLRARLKDLKKRQADPTVIVSGDNEATLGKTVSVLDEARKIGIKKFAIQSQ